MEIIYVLIAIITVQILKRRWINKPVIDYIEGKTYYAKARNNGTWYYYDKKTGKKIGYRNRYMNYIEWYDKDE